MKLDKLTAKIKPHEIQWRVQSKGNGKTTVVPYLTNRCVMERFDEQFGATEWQNVFCEWRSKGVKCGISVRVGDEWVTKYDGADETNIEATKGGFSDSMKRAAVQWGLGRDLYDYPMIQLEGEYKYIPRIFNRELSDVSEQVSSGQMKKDYILLDGKSKAKPELKPDTEAWEKAIKYLVDGGVISAIEGKYALSEVNKQLLMDKVLS